MVTIYILLGKYPDLVVRSKFKLSILPSCIVIAMWRRDQEFYLNVLLWKRVFLKALGLGIILFKDVVLNYLTRCLVFKFHSISVPGTVQILQITKYFSYDYIEASITWLQERFVWFFPSTCVTTTSNAHSFGLCISKGVFIIQ